MKSDVPIRRLLQVRREDWISFLFPELEEINLSDMPTDMIPKAESRMDNVKNVNNEFVSHIEPNGYFDCTIPARMLRYRADIWEYTLSKNRKTPHISQTVILFFEKHDNKIHSLHDNHFKGQKLNYEYKVIKAWEINSKDILNRKLVGLYPLLPLTKHDDFESLEKIITDSIKTIQTVDDSALQSDLLSVMSILAGEKYSKELIKKYVRREQLMETALFNEWVAEFVDEAFKEGYEKQRFIVAKKLLQRGMPLDEIMDITELSMEKIEELQTQH